MTELLFTGAAAGPSGPAVPAGRGGHPEFCHPLCLPQAHPALLRAGGRSGVAGIRDRGAVRDGSLSAASLLAVIPLTLLARILAMTLRAPVTVFLLTGIFPLVPGAGIYYSAYYFIQGDNALALANGISTFKIAVALAVGIALVLGIPLPQKRR